MKTGRYWVMKVKFRDGSGTWTGIFSGRVIEETARKAIMANFEELYSGAEINKHGGVECQLFRAKEGESDYSLSDIRPCVRRALRRMG